MFEKLSESSGPIVGYRIKGKITAEDYAQLGADMQALVDQYDETYMLIDVQEFSGEEAKAWLPDLKFGHQFHDNIQKMAIVGDQRWEGMLSALVKPFYAQEGRVFAEDDIDAAWAWLREA